MRRRLAAVSMGLLAWLAWPSSDSPARAQPVLPHPWPPKPRPPCDKVIDIGFPDTTEFPYKLAFDVGHSDLGRGDSIVIEEVRGTRPRFEVGGIYLVRGEYTLDSIDAAQLSLTVTATRQGDGCTKGNPRGRLAVNRGKGKFEIASPIAYLGYPHVWFRVGDASAGGVYFGTGSFLKK